MAGDRDILHVDMDAFYASVEQRDRPELRGTNLVVGGGGNRGVVAAASYAARRYGIRSAMPMREARRRCPDLVQVPPRMAHYKAVSETVFAIFNGFTPLVEGLSLDEAFLDVTASRSLFGAPADIGAAIKRRILEETGLTASVGVAPNKLVAKIASDLDKPDGLVVVTPENLRATLDPLPVETLPGVGKVTLRRLLAVDIRTMGDLREAPSAVLDLVFGRYAERMRERAAGIDDRPVVSDRDDKSLSAEETFDVDLEAVPDMHRKLLQLAERTAGRLRAKGLIAGTVQVKIRLNDFTTCTRQKSIHPPSNATARLYGAARELLAAWLAEHPGARLRLLGVGGSELSTETQPDLFAQQAPRGDERLDRALDTIREKFGSRSVGRARSLDPDQIG